MNQKKRCSIAASRCRWMSLIATMCALLLAVCLSSCNIEKRPLITTFDKAGITKLLKERQGLCIVSFTADPTLYTWNGGELDLNPGMLPVKILANKDANRAQAAEIAAKLTSAHYQQTVAGFSEKFQLVGASTYDEVSTPITRTYFIREAITKAGAEFGLTVHDQFGWDWASENNGVEQYFFRSCATIFDNAGQSIWKFCSKGSLNPNPLDLRSFASGIAGAAPPTETIIADFGTYFTYYPKLLIRLIEEDVQGKTHAAWFEDYFTPKDRFGRPLIVNIDDERYSPKFP